MNVIDGMGEVLNESGTLYRMYGGAIAHRGVNLGNWDEGRTRLNFFDQGHCLSEGGGCDSGEDLLDALSKVWGFCANFRGMVPYLAPLGRWMSMLLESRGGCPAISRVGRCPVGIGGGVVAGSHHINCRCSGEGL